MFAHEAPSGGAGYGMTRLSMQHFGNAPRSIGPASRCQEGPQGQVRAIIGVRTQGLDIVAGAKQAAVDRAGRRGGNRHSAMERAARPRARHAPTILAALLSGTRGLICSALASVRAAPLRALYRNHWHRAIIGGAVSTPNNRWLQSSRPTVQQRWPLQVGAVCLTPG
jgi:hypothetical protein